jgi:hypothetical protein
MIDGNTHQVEHCDEVLLPQAISHECLCRSLDWAKDSIIRTSGKAALVSIHLLFQKLMLRFTAHV